MFDLPIRPIAPGTHWKHKDSARARNPPMPDEATVVRFEGHDVVFVGDPRQTEYVLTVADFRENYS